MYKLTNSNSITRLADSASIPNDPANTDYAQYLQWRDGWIEKKYTPQGELIETIEHLPNTPEPADTPAVYVEPVVDQIARLEREQLLPRVSREFMLAYLEATYNPEQLTENIAYTKLKAFDESIKALRSQL